MAVTKRSLIGSLILAVVLVTAVFAAYTWVTLNWSFSRGERVGYVQKLSQKGWLVKTWEGELQMLPVPGAVPEKFEFSVREDEIAHKLNAAVGKKVSVYYEQHRGVPTRFFGETEYYVSDVKIIE